MQVFFYQTKIQKPLASPLNDVFCVSSQNRRDADKLFFQALNAKYDTSNSSINFNVIEVNLEDFIQKLEMTNYMFPSLKQNKEENKQSLIKEIIHEKPVEDRTQLNKQSLVYTLLGIRDNVELVKTRADKNALDRIIARIKPPDKV